MHRPDRCSLPRFVEAILLQNYEHPEQLVQLCICKDWGRSPLDPDKAKWNLQLNYHTFTANGVSPQCPTSLDVEGCAAKRSDHAMFI